MLWWEEVRLCRCRIFFLSLGKMKGDKDGKAKGKGQDPPTGAPNPTGALTDSDMTPMTFTCRYETTACGAETIEE